MTCSGQSDGLLSMGEDTGKLEARGCCGLICSLLDQFSVTYVSRSRVRETS